MPKHFIPEQADIECYLDTRWLCLQDLELWKNELIVDPVLESLW